MTWTVVVEFHGEPARAVGSYRTHAAAVAAQDRIDRELDAMGVTGAGMEAVPHVEELLPDARWREVLG